MEIKALPLNHKEKGKGLPGAAPPADGSELPRGCLKIVRHLHPTSRPSDPEKQVSKRRNHTEGDISRQKNGMLAHGLPLSFTSLPSVSEVPAHREALTPSGPCSLIIASSLSYLAQILKSVQKWLQPRRCSYLPLSIR